MRRHVLPQARDGFRPFPAVGALILFIGGMIDDGVLPELTLVAEGHAADGARRRHHLALVDRCHVRPQLSRGRELLGTPVTINVQSLLSRLLLRDGGTHVHFEMSQVNLVSLQRNSTLEAIV